MKRRTFLPAFKAELVQTVLRGEKTLAQIAGDQQIHPNMLTQWKAIALKGLPSLFEEGRKNAQREDEHQGLVEELYGQIGRLTTENAWLKKKSGLKPNP
jgi:transposase